MNRSYTEEILERIKNEFKSENLLALPMLKGISVSLRVGRFKEDLKSVESAKEDILKITGQAPSERFSKKAISSFKLKEGDLVGLLVTLRGQKMWQFLEKLTKVVLPSVRDFQGLKSQGIDKGGNLSIGFRDQTAFPEIDPNKIDKLRGLGVTLTVARLGNEDEAKKFYECLGFKFNKFR